MVAKTREKVQSTAFSNFVRNASDEEKRNFFGKVIKQAVAEQRTMIEQARAMSENKGDVVI